jgi:hypothetical protein
LFSYQGYKAYQPFNVWWAEQGLVLNTEFRDGNVPAGYEQLRVFEEALEMLPEGVSTVYLRSDTGPVRSIIFCDTVRQDRTSGSGKSVLRLGWM